MTVAEIFRQANLTPHGPVSWGTPILESSEGGVYVVARVGDPTINCEACDLPFEDPLPRNLILNLDRERRRWLPEEPVLYIGRTTQRLRQRIHQFDVHQVGQRSPHSGGQVVKLLRCDRWVYWSPTTQPRERARAMLSAFEKQVGQLPFAVGGYGKKKRIWCID